MRYYYITRHKEDDSYWGSFEGLHGVTQGASPEEFNEMAEDLLICIVEDFISLGRYFPNPLPKQEGQQAIAMSTLVELKVLIHNKLVELGINKSELARRLQSSPAEVQRILNPRHNTKVMTLERAFNVLGGRFTVGVA